MNIGKGKHGMTTWRCCLMPAVLLHTFACSIQADQEPPLVKASIAMSPDMFVPPPPKHSCKALQLKQGQRMTTMLASMSVDKSEQLRILNTLSSVLDFSKLQPGLTLEHCMLNDRTAHIDVKEPNSLTYWRLRPSENKNWRLTKNEIQTRSEEKRFVLRITTSMGQAVFDAKAKMSLAYSIGDLLAWDLDLRRDLRRNDQLVVLVDEILGPEGEHHGYGPIKALAFNGQLEKLTYYFFDHAGHGQYFDEAGQSVERSLLSTPMKFFRISSGFSSKRKHPILGYTKAHNGVDYAAPIGTPIWSVGKGTVRYAGWKGANGKLIRIDHGGGYQTAYAHLSRIHPKIKRGAAVEAKQIIGYVGTTGRSTGPHLHFAVKKNGRFINPLSVERPRRNAIPKERQAAFTLSTQALKRRLWPEVEVRRPAP